LLYAVLAVAAVQLSTLGLLVSTRAQSTDGALRATYALVLAVCVLTLVPHALVRGGWRPLVEAAAWLRALSPIPAVMEVLGQGDVGSEGMAGGAGPIACYLLLAPLASLACALATVARLNHTLFDRARPAGVMTQDRPAEEQARRRLMFLVDPQRRGG